MDFPKGTFYGEEILDSRVILDTGSFRRVRYWLRGHVKPFKGYGRYIEGFTGPETVVDSEMIYPSHVEWVVNDSESVV